MDFAQLIANRRNQRLGIAIMFLVCAALQFGRYRATHSLIGGDAVLYYMSLRSLCIDHDLDFSNEYDHFHNETSGFTGNRKIPTLPARIPATGALPNKYPLGSALVLAPFFMLGHFASLLMRGCGVGGPPDGYGAIYQFAAGAGSIVVCFAGLLLLYLYGQRRYGTRIAAVSVLAIFLATPLVYYTTVEPLMSHTVSMGAVAAFIALWYLTDVKGLVFSILMGAIAGVICITRYQDAFFCLLPVLDLSLRAIFGSARLTWSRVRLVHLGAFALVGSAIGSTQLLANHTLYGSWIASGYAREGFPYLSHPHILTTLFSLHSGLVTWSPLVLFSLVGLVILLRKDVVKGAALSMLCLIQVYLVSSWWAPEQGDSFGNRMLLNCTGIFAVGLMQLLAALEPRKRLFAVVLCGCAACVVLNATLAGLYCFRIIGNPY